MKTLSDQLAGKSSTHLSRSKDYPNIHHKAYQPFLDLKKAAAIEGFDLTLLSGFRSHDKQLAIWNAKAKGQRVLRDAKGNILNFSSLSPDDIVESILNWSAIPGASRHHWGTDLDIYDAKALPDNYEIQLTIKECETYFKPFHQWLDEALPKYGFFRPYEKYQGGVQQEPWHISFEEIATQYYDAYDFSLFENIISDKRIHFSSILESKAKEIFERYVKNICNP